MKDLIPQVEKRSFQYWFIDGIFEIALGSIFLALSGYYQLQYSLPEESPVRTLLNASFILVFLGMWFGTGWLVRLAKQRLTYPRTGFIAYHKKPPRRWLALGLGMLVSSSFLAVILTAPPTLSWISLLTSLVVAVMLSIFGWKSGLVRFFILALLALASGGILSLLNLPDMRSLSWLFLVWSFFLAVSGGSSLVRYLHDTRPALEDPDAG